MTMAKAGATFDLLLDKATSQLLLDTDWEAILQICDLVQQGDTQAKYAIGAIKKKLKDNNPHVALYALEVLESVVKNCGQTIRDEVASRQTMEELKDLLKKQTTDPNVKFKILYLIQAWAQAFRTEPKCKVVQDTYQNLKSDGHVFPEFKDSDAMFFSTEKVPCWSDGETCHRCRDQFGLLINKKHHCRNCGQVFCAKCSSKTTIVTKVAADKEVRVCDPCHELLNSPKRKSKTKAARGKGPDLSPTQSQGETAPSAPSSQRRDEQLQAEEELQLAIALSQSEAEEKERMRHKYSYYPKAEPTSSLAVSTLYSSPANASAPSDEDAHPELARYLNRTYWEKKQEDACRGPTPSAPAPTPLAELLPPVDGRVPHQSDNVAGQQQYRRNDDGASEENHQQFLKALQNNVTTFLNRIRSNQNRGRSITNDSAVLSLFRSIDDVHPRLRDLLNQLEEKRLYYEGLQDKLSQVFDAQAALNALRDEHREKVRRAAEEADRQRKIQLAHKLEIMRQKKQEYLDMQRQQAIQRMQEEENESRIRLEMQKHAVQMRAQMPAFTQSYGPIVGGGVAYPSYATAMPAVVCRELGGYMVQPGQTGVPGGQYQATDANMVDAYMRHTAGATNGQPAPPSLAPPPTVNPASSGYQPAPPQGYLVSEGQRLTSMPQAAAPADGTGYMGYQPFGMQGMRSALPGHDAVIQGMRSALPGHDANVMMAMGPGSQHLTCVEKEAPSGGHRQPQQQQQTPQTEAQLISFD